MIENFNQRERGSLAVFFPLLSLENSCGHIIRSEIVYHIQMTQAESFKKEDDIEISSISIIERLSADTQKPLAGSS